MGERGRLGQLPWCLVKEAGAVTGLSPSGGTLSPPALLSTPQTEEWVGKCLKGRGEGPWDEEPIKGERAKEEAGGEVRAQAGTGWGRERGPGPEGGRQPGRESAGEGGGRDRLGDRQR